MVCVTYWWAGMDNAHYSGKAKARIDSIHRCESHQSRHAVLARRYEIGNNILPSRVLSLFKAEFHFYSTFGLTHLCKAK